ncbi:SoxR reducing system RseC family protein [bacterium]|nr:SoxR reducing system RseC family protein [bacterium]
MSERDVESGMVILIQGDKARVRLLENDACEECNARIFCRPGSDGVREMLAYNHIKASVGDRVDIAETSNLLLKLSFMQFGVPLIGLLSGILFVNVFNLALFSFPHELVMSIGGLIGLLLGGTLTWIWSKKVAKTISCVFEISAIQNR